MVGSDGYIARAVSSYAQKTNMEIYPISTKGMASIDSETGMLSKDYYFPKAIDAIIFFSQSPYYKHTSNNIDHLFRVNQCLPIQIANMSYQLGVKQFIYLSTGSVYKPSFNPISENATLNKSDWYTLSKTHAEESLQLFNNLLDIKIIRLFGVYGPGQTNKLASNIINSVKEGNDVLIQGNLSDENDDGGLKVLLCYINDFINILFKLLSIDGSRIVNIGGEKPISIKEIALSAGDILNKDPKIVISSEYRDGDMISDNSKLYTLTKPKFTPFLEAMSTITESTE